MIAFNILVPLALTICVFARARHQSHIAHLEFLLREATHGGDPTNLWDHPCGHCKRRMRGSAAATYTDTVSTPGGGTRTTTTAFHSCRVKCAAAANRYAASLNQHQEQQ